MQVARKITLYNALSRFFLNKSDNVFSNPKKDRAIIVFSSIAINLLSLALPLAILHFYDQVLPNQNVSEIILLVSCVVAAVFVETSIRLIRAYILSWSAAFMEHKLTYECIKHFVHADTHHQSADHGKFMHHFDSIAKIKVLISGQVLQNIIDILFVGIFLAIIFYISNSLVLVPLALLGCLIVILFLCNKRIYCHYIAKEQCDERKYRFIIEALRGMHTVKSFGLEPIFARRHEQFEEQSASNAYHVSMQQAVIVSLCTLFNQIMVLSIVCVGAIMALHNHITMGALVAVVLLTGRTVQPIQSIMMLWLKWHEYHIAKNNISSFLKLPQTPRANTNNQIEKKGAITADNVSFYYNKPNDMILKNISLTLNPCDIISISGQYYCGKTTLLKVLAGLLVPTNGTVTIDSAQAHQYSDSQLSQHVAYIPSDSLIYKGSVRENLTAFRSGDVEKNALEIAQLLEIEKEVTQLPNGYETMLNDTLADPISPGLKQRITIARALAQKPKVLLFDNADKSLDKKGYECLISLLGALKGKATMILTSDDRNIVSLAQREYTLSNGSLLEQKFDSDSKFYDLTPNKEFRL